MYQLSEPKSKGGLYYKTSNSKFCDCIDEQLIQRVLSNNLTNEDKRSLYVNTKAKGLVDLHSFEYLLEKTNRICKFVPSECNSKVQVEVYSKISDPLRPMGSIEFNRILNTMQ
jgi:hypothetical protein